MWRPGFTVEEIENIVPSSLRMFYSSAAVFCFVQFVVGSGGCADDGSQAPPAFPKWRRAGRRTAARRVRARHCGLSGVMSLLF